MLEWVNDYAQRLDFVPISICDGTTIYNAQITQPNTTVPELQKVERWEVKRKLQAGSGIEAGMLDQSRWFRPEFYAYSSIPNGQFFEVIVEANPQTEPPGTVLVHGRATAKQGRG